MHSTPVMPRTAQIATSDTSSETTIISESAMIARGATVVPAPISSLRVGILLSSFGASEMPVVSRNEDASKLKC